MKYEICSPFCDCAEGGFFSGNTDLTELNCGPANVWCIRTGREFLHPLDLSTQGVQHILFIHAPQRGN